jgi:hypothetical protein
VKPQGAMVVVGGDSRTELVRRDFGHLDWERGVVNCKWVEQILTKDRLPSERA